MTHSVLQPYRRSTHMRIRRTLMMTLTVAIALSAICGLFHLPVKATDESVYENCTAFAPPPPVYTVAPADTDGTTAENPSGHQLDCLEPVTGIGCQGRWGQSAAPNHPHLFYLPPEKQSGKLLVFFNGGGGTPNPEMPIYAFAASRGYHVIGLSYPASPDAAEINKCSDDSSPLSCYEAYMHEVLCGTDCKHDKCNGLDINDHAQDAALN